uniref:Uncharacterized protein n=1 Tax=Arundo donax TaxID=35708 RepID=A0A0A9GI38_ARUDO
MLASKFTKFQHLGSKLLYFYPVDPIQNNSQNNRRTCSCHWHSNV